MMALCAPAALVAFVVRPNIGSSSTTAAGSTSPPQQVGGAILTIHLCMYSIIHPFGLDREMQHTGVTVPEDGDANNTEAFRAKPRDTSPFFVLLQPNRVEKVFSSSLPHAELSRFLGRRSWKILADLLVLIILSVRRSSSPV